MFQELRRRSEESEDDRDGILRRLTAANRLREEAVGNVEKAVKRIADMHEVPPCPQWLQFRPLLA